MSFATPQELTLVLEGLFVSIYSGDVNNVQKYLAAHPELTHARLNDTLQRRTPLMAAASTGSLAILKVLVDHHADVNFQSIENNFRNALMVLLLQPQADLGVVAFLLQETNLSIVTDKGYSAFSCAPKSGPVFELLLAAAKREPNLLKKFFFFSVIYNQADNVRCLLSQYITLSIDELETSWHIAIDCGAISVLELLLPLQKESLKSCKAPLIAWCLRMPNQIDALKMMSLLLPLGADPNIQASEDVSSPLVQAANNGWPLVIASLLERGAEIESVNAEGQTALMSAAAMVMNCIEQKTPYEDCMTILEHLLAAGADSAVVMEWLVSEENFMLFMDAYLNIADASKKLPCILREFLRIEVGSTLPYLQPLLMVVGLSGQDTAVRMLLEGHLDIEAKDMQNRSTLLAVMQEIILRINEGNSYEDLCGVMDVLLEKDASLSESILYLENVKGVMQSNLPTVRFIFKLTDWIGWTQVATKPRKKLEAVQAVLDKMRACQQERLEHSMQEVAGLSRATLTFSQEMEPLLEEARFTALMNSVPRARKISEASVADSAVGLEAYRALSGTSPCVLMENESTQRFSNIASL